MADHVHDTIEQLVAEEHSLWDAEAAGTATDASRQRLEQIRVDLDRYWDLYGGGGRSLRRAARRPTWSCATKKQVEDYHQSVRAAPATSSPDRQQRPVFSAPAPCVRRAAQGNVEGTPARPPASTRGSRLAVRSLQLAGLSWPRRPARARASLPGT